MRWAHAIFECSRCGEEYPNADALRAHALEHRRLDREDERRQVDAPRPVGFACSLCGAEFRTSEGLRSHTAAHAYIRGRARASVDTTARPVASPDAAARPVASPDAARPSALPDAAAASESVLRVVPGPSVEEVSSHRAPPAHSMPKAAALLAASVIFLLLVATSALAWFTASTEGSVTISTGTWGDALRFEPGHSRALHWSDAGAPDLLTIARRSDEGDLSLDFGDAPPGGHRTWPDVLRVTSTAAAPLRVSLSVNGAIGECIGDVWLAKGVPTDALEPGRPRSIRVRLAVPEGVTPGEYTGALTVGVVGGTETHTFAMTIRIGSTTPSPSSSPSGAPEPSPDPSASSEPSPAPSPDPSGSAEPGPSPEPDPSPEPSPDPSGSAQPDPSPEPDPSPTPRVLYALSPGSSTALPSSSAHVPVARASADGTIRLDFGEVPVGETVVFSDVARLSAANDAITVTLAVCGPAAALVHRVGFSDGAGGFVCGPVTLSAGETGRLAFEIQAIPGSSSGPYQGTLTVTARTADGFVQCDEVPLVVTVAPAFVAPDDDASALEAVLGVWLRCLSVLSQRSVGALLR